MTLQRWPATVPALTDEVVTLRAWGPEDADAVLAACSDPDVERWTPLPSPYLPEHAAGFVGRAAPKRWASGRAAPFAVVSAAGGEVLGFCGLVRVDEVDLVGEVGYWTAPWARGLGVAQRGVRLVVGWAFAELDLFRLEFLVDVDNLASRRVAERIGGRFEGVLRGRSLHRGVRRDLALYALLRRSPDSPDSPE
jgi:RimJ/RimL family protein N-acetyltransferase